MKRFRTFRLWFVALLVILFSPSGSLGIHTAAASGMNWHVLAGGSTPDSAVVGMTYYPDTITIDVGDSITWTVQGDAHTVTFLSGAPPPPRLSPQGGRSAGGTAYDGTGFVNSGRVRPIPGQNTYTLTFTTAGTFAYVCLLHPGMAGTVAVQPAGTPYPKTQAQYDEAATVRLQQDLAAGVSLMNSAPPPTTSRNADGSTNYNVPAGLSVGMAMPSLMRFVPNTLTIAVGDTVTWAFQDPMVVHTVTFASDGNYPDFPSVKAFTPAGGPTYDGSTFTNSGVILPKDVPLAQPLAPGIPSTDSYTLKFTKPGTYTYHCLVHDEGGMVAKIRVVSPGTAPGPQGSLLVQVTRNPHLGTILTNAQGKTLYFLTSEAGEKVKCAGKCLDFWPPLGLPAGMTDPTAGPGLTGVLETFTRPDGIEQVAYGESPLYTFAGDKAPGDANGQGIKAFGGVWLAARTTSFPLTTPIVTAQGSGAVSASFVASWSSSQPGQGEVYFGSGPGCSGLVEVATQDLTPGSTTHTVQVTGNDLPGTVDDNGIQPGATYSFELVTVTNSGVQTDDNAGKCYSAIISSS
jgi:plastocyanin